MINNDYEMTSIAHKILTLCSRDNGHKEMYALLTEALKKFDNQSGSWNHLICEAEIQGIIPLVHKHISACQYHLPLDISRLLQTLKLRASRANEIRNRLTIDILKKFDTNGIDILLLKGIALCHTVYNTPGSRPMRDIDLLVRKTDADKACTLLSELNFEQKSSKQLPADYHHLPPLTKSIQGLEVSVEIHRELLPKQFNLPSFQLESLSRDSMAFSIDGITALTLSLEHTLHYKYLHGFRAPLTFEPFRLLHAADIISIVEKFHDIINWQKLEHMCPTIYNVLSRLHFLSPWHPRIIDALPLKIGDKPTQTGIPYCGWPHRKLSTVPLHEFFGYCKDTIWPSQWWTQIYYGHIEGKNYLKARIIDHPRTLWRWAKSYRQYHKVALGKK